jgi:hypothetical protein
MVVEVLLDSHREQGAELLRALDDAGVAVRAAFWRRDLGLERWELLFAVAGARGPRQALGLIYPVVDVALDRSSGLETFDVNVVDPDSALVRRLHRLVGDVSGIQRRHVPECGDEDGSLPATVIYRLLAAGDEPARDSA